MGNTLRGRVETLFASLKSTMFRRIGRRRKRVNRKILELYQKAQGAISIKGFGEGGEGRITSEDGLQRKSWSTHSRTGESSSLLKVKEKAWRGNSNPQGYPRGGGGANYGKVGCRRSPDAREGVFKVAQEGNCVTEKLVNRRGTVQAR